MGPKRTNQKSTVALIQYKLTLKKTKKDLKCEIRKLKVYSKYVSKHGNSRVIGELRISGIWIEKYGFQRGTIVDVICQPNELRIVRRSREVKRK